MLHQSCFDDRLIRVMSFRLVSAKIDLTHCHGLLTTI